jgi:hypothetical protein
VLFRPKGSIYDKTVVRPGKYVDRFINVSHAADPVPAPRRFAPKTWGAGYHEIVLKHYRDPNLHAFIHYLEHPAVAGALFQELVPFLLSDVEVAAVAASYRDVDGHDELKRTRIERLIADIARELHEAYDDERNVISDSVELFAGVARRAWRNRKAFGELS